MKSTKGASLQVSSSEVSTSRFAPHGTFDIWTDGDILHYDATGPFNLEALQALAAARAKIVTQWRPGRRVGALVHWHNSALMSPQAFAAYGEGLAKFHENANTPAALAWVAAPEVEGMGMMVEKFSDLFASHNINFRLFATLEPAIAWIHARLEQVKRHPTP